MNSTGVAGVVASGHPVAAEAGRRALALGGTAVDAVLAMAFCQWVVNAPLCGPGGDLFILHVRDGVPTVYGGWSSVPMAFPAGAPVPYAGVGSAVVPGALPAAYAAWQGGGRLPWADLAEGALVASRGHAVTPWMASSYASVENRGHGAALRAVLDQTQVPVTGDWISSSRLGSSLRLIAEGGPDVLHGGGVLADRVLSAARVAGAFLTADDLAHVRPDVGPAEVVELDGLTVAYPGAPSQSGITAELLAGVDRNVPVEDREFAQALARATEDALVRRCVVGLPGTATSVAATGDEAAIVVHSLAGVQFGSGWVAGDTGIALGNRVGTALTERPDLPAANPRPGQSPPHTLSAAWLRAGDRQMLIATPGGDRQVQWLAQAAQRFRQGHAADQIVTAPRWFVCPEGDRFGVPQGIGAPWYLFAEPGISWRADAELDGYPVRAVDSVGGGLQAVQRTGSGSWTSASDPRAGGAALALP